jgi:hypothetical protein
MEVEPQTLESSTGSDSGSVQRALSALIRSGWSMRSEPREDGTQRWVFSERPQPPRATRPV